MRKAVAPIYLTRKEGVERLGVVVDAHTIVWPVETVPASHPVPDVQAAVVAVNGDGDPVTYHVVDAVADICRKVRDLGDPALRPIELRTSGGFHVVAVNPWDLVFPITEVRDSKKPEIHAVLELSLRNGSRRRLEVQETLLEIQRLCR